MSVATVHTAHTYHELIGDTCCAFVIILPRQKRDALKWSYRVIYESAGLSARVFTHIETLYAFPPIDVATYRVMAVPFRAGSAVKYVQLVERESGDAYFLHARHGRQENPYEAERLRVQRRDGREPGLELTMLGPPVLPPEHPDDDAFDLPVQFRGMDEHTMATLEDFGMAALNSMRDELEEHAPHLAARVELADVQRVESTPLTENNNRRACEVELDALYTENTPYWLEADSDDEPCLYWCHERHWLACNKDESGMVPCLPSAYRGMSATARYPALVSLLSAVYVSTNVVHRTFIDTNAVSGGGRVKPYYLEDIGRQLSRAGEGYALLDALTLCETTRRVWRDRDYSTDGRNIDYNDAYCVILAPRLYDYEADKHLFSPAYNPYLCRRWGLEQHERVRRTLYDKPIDKPVIDERGKVRVKMRPGEPPAFAGNVAGDDDSVLSTCATEYVALNRGYKRMHDDLARLRAPELPAGARARLVELAAELLCGTEPKRWPVDVELDVVTGSMTARHTLMPHEWLLRFMGTDDKLPVEIELMTELATMYS